MFKVSPGLNWTSEVIKALIIDNIMKVWMALPLLWFISCTKGDEEKCGGIFQERRGVIQTPNFPKKFRVPIHCRWVINATNYNGDDIIIYFTQLFVTRGLTFTESYQADSASGRTIHEVTEQNVTLVQWLLTKRNYLVIDFSLNQLEGNHLRVMNNLLDVYGFNLTYEISTKVRDKTCSVTECSLSGHCYASHNFTDYWCSCFPEFSDPYCGHGPLCESEKYACENEGTCRHAGDKLALCSCPDGFFGSKCEVALQVCDDQEASCTEQCLVNYLSEPCSCEDKTNLELNIEDPVRYETTVQLTDVKALSSCLENLRCQWILMLEQQITKFLNNNNITVVGELKVINVTLEAEIRFAFIAGGNENYSIKKCLGNMVGDGYLGFNSSYFLFEQEPALYLKSVEINQEDYVIDEGTEFIVSCVAQGSPHMVFRWFKDGVFVNVSKSQRNMWTTLLPLDSTVQYTALLGIDHAEVLDQGQYTCQITDHGYQQCKTIALEVIEAPQLKIYPMSLSVDKGANISIQCISPDEMSYSYVWTKGNRLIKPSLTMEYSEKLFPIGSMLNVNSIQESTTYTCHLGPQSKSVLVEVSNHSTVTWCPAEDFNDVRWKDTIPGSKIMLDCPLSYSGTVSRLCVLSDKDQAQWMMPDYSECLSDNLAATLKMFRKVTFGYGNTTITQIMVDLLTSLDSRNALYPGEGEPYIQFLQNIIVYLGEQRAWSDVLDSTWHFYRIIDVLLLEKNAIIHDQKIIELQQLVNKWGLMWGHQDNKNIAHLSFDTIVVDLFKYNSSWLEEGIVEIFPKPLLSYPPWYSSQITVHIPSNLIGENETASLSVVSYNNLPQSNTSKATSVFENFSGVAYEMASSVMRVIASNVTNVRTEITFEWLKKKGMELKCGMSVDFGATWNLSVCQTSQLFFNVTLCSCPMMGSYTLFMVKEKNKAGQVGNNSFTIIVLVGCICCLVQSFLTLMFLMFHWLHVPSCYILFLKLQCCSAIFLTMVMFLYSIFCTEEQMIYLYSSAWLQMFTLIALSSQLCKLLLIYIEIIYIPKLKHLKPTMIVGVTGAPILLMFFTRLVQSDEPNTRPKWLPSSTTVFCTYLFCVILLVFVFVFVYLKVYRRLKVLKKTKHVESKKAVMERIGLLIRAVLVVAVTTIMLVSCLFYQNWPNIFFQFLFGVSCALLGFVLMLSYTVYSERTLQIQGLHVLRIDNADLGYSSESDSSPQRFCDKQEPTTSKTNKPTDIDLDTMSPRLQCIQSSGSAESTGSAGKVVCSVANSGDSNDSGVQLEIPDSKSLGALPSYDTMTPKPTRSVTFHNVLVEGIERVKTYPESPQIKRMDSEIQIIPPPKKKLLRYQNYRQPANRTVCVLVDRPQIHILGPSIELKTEARVVH